MTLKDNFHYIASSNIKETKFNQDGLRLREKYENERCLNLLLRDPTRDGCIREFIKRK